jgi:AcrR family transcriptional regulator
MHTIRMKTTITKQKIIDAALIEFSQNGFEATTTKQITQRAGVNEVTLFRTFGNKETILQQTIQTSKMEAMNALESALTQIENGNLKEKLYQVYLELFRVLEPRTELLILQIWEGRKRIEVNETLSEIPKAMAEKLSRILDEEVSKGNIRKIDTMNVATVFFGHLFHQALLRKIADCQANAALRVDPETFIDILLNGISAETIK